VTFSNGSTSLGSVSLSGEYGECGIDGFAAGHGHDHGNLRR
jgi:hypothetical protein